MGIMTHLAFKNPFEVSRQVKRRPIRVRVQPDPSPLHRNESVGIFALTEALGSAEAALVVWKLRGWLHHNQAKNAQISYRDGRWWTFSSLEKWCERDFKWLTPRQLGTIMKKLEDMQVIIRRQYGAKGLKMSYWYSVNDDVIASMTTPTQQADACNDFVESSDISVESFDKNVASKTVVKEKQIQENSATQNTQQQPDAATAVVVEDIPQREPEAESGEHSLNAEGPDTTAVKAFVPHEQHYDDEPLSKVPPKVLPVIADLEAFGVLPSTAQRLAREYSEAEIRHVVSCARLLDLKNPPGFVVAKLDSGQGWALRPLTARATDALSRVVDDDGRTALTSYAVLDVEALRRENARMAAEDEACHAH